MKIARIVAGVLLGATILFFSVSYFIYPSTRMPPADGTTGSQFVHALDDAGLRPAINLIEAVLGIGLLIPRTRFLAALLRLPMTLCVLTLNPALWNTADGILWAMLLLVLHLIVLCDPARIRALFRSDAELALSESH